MHIGPLYTCHNVSSDCSFTVKVMMHVLELNICNIALVIVAKTLGVPSIK